MIKNVIIPLIVIVAIGVGGYWLFHKSQYKHPLPQTATNVDLQKYSGYWYEIALLPNRFEKGCTCTTATYTLVNNHIKVENTCFKTDKNNYVDAKGKAWPVNEDNSKLKVQFMWPFRGDYWILYVDENYKYALVGTPTRKHLWILSRRIKMPEEEYAKLVAIAKQQGFDVSKLIRIVHECTT